MANEKQKHTLFLRAGDMDYIASAMPTGKASFFVRRVVSNAVDRLKAKESASHTEHIEITDDQLDL